MARGYNRGVVLKEIALTHEQLRSSPCPICRLIARIKPADLDGIPCKPKTVPRWDYHSVDLRALFISSSRGDTVRNLDRGLLIMRKLDDLDPSKSRLDHDHIRSLWVDFNSVQPWLATCSAIHGPICMPDDANGLRELRVIDRNTGLVVPAPRGCEYVALSYVWGTAESVTTATTHDQHAVSSFPLAIQDSVEVTLQMGYQFLWVDRYVSPRHKQKLRICITNILCGVLTRTTRASMFRFDKWTRSTRVRS